LGIGKSNSEIDKLYFLQRMVVHFIMINRTMMHHPMHLHGLSISVEIGYMISKSISLAARWHSDYAFGGGLEARFWFQRIPKGNTNRIFTKL